MDGEAPIIGADLGDGGGGRAALMPCDPAERPLFVAQSNYIEGDDTREIALDVWGLDPRLSVTCAFYRRPNPNRTTDSYPGTNITATIAANLLFASAVGVVVGPALSGEDLFVNGGALDGDGVDDGCELVTAAQGVRFTLTATRTGPTDVDIVAVIQARPNVALGCRELALALLSGVTVSQPTAQTWPSGE